MYNFEALIVGLRAEWELRSQVSSWLFFLGKRLVCTGWKRLVEEGVEFETLIFRKGMKIYLKW